MRDDAFVSEPPGLVRLRLVGLRAGDPDAGTCYADFESVPGACPLTVGVRLHDGPDGIRVVTTDPDVFMQFDGSAEEVHEVCRLLIAFVDLAARTAPRP